MEFLGTIAILLTILFVMYRTGIIRLAQTASDRAVVVTDSATQVWELSSLESHSRKLGKIKKKLNDDNIDRSSASEIRAALNKLEVKDDSRNS